MRAFIAVIKKELTSVMRDRTILIAVLIQLFIASFSSVLLIRMLSLYDADSAEMYGTFRLNAGLVGQETQVLTGFLKDRGVNVFPYGTLDQAQSAFQKGEIQAILVQPEVSSGLVEMKLFLPDDESTSSMILNFLQDPLKKYENVLREQRGITLRYMDLKGKSPTAFEFIFSAILPILMFFPAFVAGGMVIDSISEELENLTFDTLLSAPLTVSTAIGAKITAALLLTLAQCLAWLGLLRLNRIAIHNFGWVLLLAMITAGIIAVGAAIITIFFRNRERSQFVYSLSLLVAASGSLLANVSPIKALSRLAVGDYYAGGLDVLVFASILAVMLLLLSRSTLRLKA